MIVATNSELWMENIRFIWYMWSQFLTSKFFTSFVCPRVQLCHSWRKILSKGSWDIAFVRKDQTDDPITCKHAYGPQLLSAWNQYKDSWEKWENGSSLLLLCRNFWFDLRQLDILLNVSKAWNSSASKGKGWTITSPIAQYNRLNLLFFSNTKDDLHLNFILILIIILSE